MKKLIEIIQLKKDYYVGEVTVHALKGVDMIVNEGEFVIVPKGTLHRPVVGKLTRFLMIELGGTLNKENSGELYED